MKLLTIGITALFLLSGSALTANASEEKQHSGVETSAEHQSEQGNEHDAACAGSKEKNLKDQDVEQDQDDKKTEGQEIRII